MTPPMFSTCARGVKWHNKPPLNSRELVAEDVKFTYDRFMTERANANRYMLEPLDRVEVVDRYTVKFLLKEPFVHGLWPYYRAVLSSGRTGRALGDAPCHAAVAGHREF
jgi:ABC-type transport system substrate-binding protein